ncbi:hypothetical protein [Flavobacterium sp.]|jgi:hypothetical protein|uniref:hypothetical protein n=1 Tax=Flavobacterium sp. TaxID=239 RepID=UPI0037C0C19F
MMNYSNCRFFTLCCCFFALSAFTQVKEQEKDSAKIYQDIHDLSQKSKFNKLVYKLLFRPSALSNTEKTVTKSSKEKAQNTYKASGRIIRNISIETLDPFGYSIKNANKVPKNSVDRFGNAIHIKTKEFTIRNLLLFKKHDRCDSLLLKETERLIRSQRYVREVTIVPVLVETASDSVDLKIRVLDSWTLVPNGSLSQSQNSVKVTERNILGFGHQISGELANRMATNEKARYAQYSVSNIKNSFIRLELAYANEYNNDSKRSVTLTRPFYSVVAKNAGGLEFENRRLTEFFPENDTLIGVPTKYEFVEYWYGRAFKINGERTFNQQTTNLILAFSYNHKAFSLQPTSQYDATQFFTTEKNSIGYLGISRQKFYQDKFIFNYDITEDIPYGENAALVMGYQNKGDRSRWYSGVLLAQGKKYSFGYFSSFMEWGSFYYKGKTEQTAFKIGSNYISPLLYLGRWKLRQFVKPTYIWGNNRDASFKDQLTLNNYYGIEGFNNRLTGTQKWLVSLQTQTYMPGLWNGFRFSPYINISMGSLANNKALFDSRVYSKFSVGVQINNDYLVFNSFQISFSYYPSIPFEGDNLLKTNSFENTDLTITDFQLGKPAYIRYE